MVRLTGFGVSPREGLLGRLHSANLRNDTTTHAVNETGTETTVACSHKRYTEITHKVSVCDISLTNIWEEADSRGELLGRNGWHVDFVSLRLVVSHRNAPY